MIQRLLAALSEPRARKLAFERLEKAGRVQMGRHSYSYPKFVTFDHDSTKVTIGNFVSIAGGVTFVMGGNHPTDRVTTFPLRSKLNLAGAGTDGYPYSKGDIEVGHDVWIGYGSTVLSGVTIGNGAVVAAGSIVAKDVAPYAIVAGVPAKCIRFRFDPDTIVSLQQQQWWLWPDSEIAARVGELSSRPSRQNKLEH